MASFRTILAIMWFCILQFNHKNAGAVVVDDQSLAAAAADGNQSQFDYFILVVQWPPTNCRNNQKCCQQNGCCRGANSPTEFTISGLWANYDNGTYPSCCNGPQFDENEILPFFDAINKYWPTLGTCSKASTCHGVKGLFWAHEWETHGTCAFPVVQDQNDYFIKTLNLYFKYNVTEVLNEAGYIPSNVVKYSLEGISTAIKNAFHLTPQIMCSSGSISQVRLCFYKDFKPRDCDATSSLKNSCAKSVSLPAYNSTGIENNAATTAWLTGKSSA